jgi:hypothetical protein
VSLEGRWSTVTAALSKWRSGTPAAGGTSAASVGWVPSTLDLEESRVVWIGPVAENGRVEANNVHVDLAWPTSAKGPELHARSDNVKVGVPGGTLGPWELDIEQGPGTSRVRVALDPAVPDACTVLVVGDDDRTTSVDVVVPRSPLARLGLPLELLGLRGSNLQVQTDMHFVALGPQRADVRAKGGLYSVDAGLPRPLDVSWDGAATGDPGAGIEVKRARLAAGPLVGVLSGTLRRFEDGFRVDLAWSAGPVPCNSFDASLGDGAPFDIAYQLRKLAENAGLTKVKGDVSARGTLTFDSRDLGATRVDFVPEASCQIALFGR